MAELENYSLVVHNFSSPFNTAEMSKMSKVSWKFNAKLNPDEKYLIKMFSEICSSQLEVEKVSLVVERIHQRRKLKWIHNNAQF